MNVLLLALAAYALTKRKQNNFVGPTPPTRPLPPPPEQGGDIRRGGTQYGNQNTGGGGNKPDGSNKIFML